MNKNLIGGHVRGRQHDRHEQNAANENCHLAAYHDVECRRTKGLVDHEIQEEGAHDQRCDQVQQDRQGVRLIKSRGCPAEMVKKVAASSQLFQQSPIIIPQVILLMALHHVDLLRLHNAKHVAIFYPCDGSRRIDRTDVVGHDVDSMSYAVVPDVDNEEPCPHLDEKEHSVHFSQESRHVAEMGRPSTFIQWHIEDRHGNGLIKTIDDRTFGLLLRAVMQFITKIKTKTDPTKVWS